ncbi:hypothetical protein SAMN05216456_1315 [Devosia crocina]|uniref:Uncharacterized protein n=1 Tax=Devosia crocina TaxID=429728 RepID=A0A1I7N9X6_9HYPH|nr:hypothetical protein [Devosia crocina]SFV31356.1 hypothetical protein SAMN05216456_1315 [Devosia crocina]
MRPLEDLLPRVLSMAPSCPSPIAEGYILEAAIELAGKALFWRETDSFDISAPDYEVLTPFPDATIVKIEDARFDGRKLEPIDPQRLDDELPGWQSADAPEGAPQFITQLRPGTVSVAPRTRGKLTLRCVLVPSIDARTLPDFMVTDHGIDIGKGAIARVLMHPKGEWANPQVGGLYLAEFQSILVRSHRKALKGQQNAPLRTKPSFL